MVSKTPYMWIENTVLRSGSPANTFSALSRMVCVQSWPQLGASTMSVWSKPASRMREMAFWVSGAHVS
ncbi:hypothetical protein SALBM135S_00793 [Streptomyces alboniger]